MPVVTMMEKQDTPGTLLSIRGAFSNSYYTSTRKKHIVYFAKDTTSRM